MDGSPGFRHCRGWLLVLLALTAGQGWLTLRLFGPEPSLGPLLDDEPVLSGQHPLHLYHGQLGARAWGERGTSSCYDPAFQAGYPKTPVFDPGSRPAELFLLVADGHPAAYKIGLALCCLLVPAAFALMARGVGLGAGAACVAGLLGGALWWSPPVRALIDHGDFDLLLGSLCVLVNLCWLARYSAAPGVDAWLVLTLSAMLAWYVQPLLLAGFLPLALLYYAWTAFNHGLAWHLTLVAAAVVAFLANFSWLTDWFRYLWVRLPFGDSGSALPAKPLKQLLDGWQTLLPADLLTLGVVGAGLLGLPTLFRRSTGGATLLFMAAASLFALGAAGRVWEPLHELGSEKLLTLVAWCSALPAAGLLAAVADHLGRGTGYRPLGAVWLVTGLVGLAWAADIPQGWARRPGLHIGLGPEREDLVRKLIQHTAPSGRILFEERPADGPDDGWTALLPARTERHYIGGLAPRWGVEHLFVRLADGKLAGKPMIEWTDSELQLFCQRYNVAWAVCWSEAAQARFRKLPNARPLAEVHDHGRGTLFALLPNPSYFLRGQGQVVQIDWQRVALAGVTPDADGYVVLSLHHLRGWNIAPAYVQMEYERDDLDPVPLIRLRLPGPVARLTLTWDTPKD